MEVLRKQGEKGAWPTLLGLSLAGCLLFSLVSITLMESFLALAFVFWLVALFRRETRLSVPGFFWPLLVYSALSIIVCFFSVNPAISFKDARELLLFLFAGAALSFLLFLKNRTRWLWGIAFILAAASLSLTLTRSAWVGLVVAAGFILVLYKPKALLLVPVVVALFFLVGPQPMKRRALSIFNLHDYGNTLRIEYLKTGWQIIREYPLHGTGPDTVDMVYQNPKYGLSEVSRQNVHLHNNILQIAAERGIPTLLAWVVFIVWAFTSLLS